MTLDLTSFLLGLAFGMLLSLVFVVLGAVAFSGGRR
jgi:hypothetical protein